MDQSFPHENHHDCYKKLASTSWPVLLFFSYTYFLLICWKIKSHCDCYFPQEVIYTYIYIYIYMHIYIRYIDIQIQIDIWIDRQIDRYFLASSIFPKNEQQITDAYSEPYQTCKMECLTKKVDGFQPVTIFAKHSIFDVRHGSECASGFLRLLCHGSKGDIQDC